MMKSILVIEKKFFFKFFLYSSFLSYPCLKIKSSKFSNFSLFQNHLSSDRRILKEINDPLRMVVWGFFLEIWWSEIFTNFLWWKKSHKKESKNLQFLRFMDSIEFDRDKCKQNDNELQMMRSLSILEIFDFSSFFFCLSFLDDLCWKNQVQKLSTFSSFVIAYQMKEEGVTRSMI